MDHNVPTTNRKLPIVEPTSSKQIQTLYDNCKEFDVKLFDLHNPYQGIVHIIGPELGITIPGMTLVCGDSHTSTHGALGSFAFGIGTSQVEHVLATQCIWLNRPKNFEILVEGNVPKGVSAKDIILSIIGKIGIGGGIGSVIEYRGSVIERCSIEERLTICNMSVEAGAISGLISPDEKTINYVSGKKYAPSKDFDRLAEQWKGLRTDSNVSFDKTFTLNATKIIPQVTWGTNPGMVTDVTGQVPDPRDIADQKEKITVERAIEYMDLVPGDLITDIKLDRVFIGSCTNARISDLEEAAKVVKGHKISPHIEAMVVPGSQTVKREAERKGLHTTFENAGFKWRNSGCSMCLGMNPDILGHGERCASTSNRNYEGRQGSGGRTHLVSPAMAAAAAIAGHFVDVREWS